MSVHPRQRPGAVLEPSADGYLARVPGTGSVTWLNRTAYIVYELCTGGNDIPSIARAVEQAFAMTSTPLPEVRDAVADLVAAGLVTPGDTVPRTDFSLVVAVWAPGASVPSDAMTLVQGLLVDAARDGIEATLALDHSRSMRTARNRTASRVVREATATHVLFLDAAPQAIRAVRESSIISLIRSQHEVIGIPVTAGEPVWERARQAMDALPEVTAREVQQYAQGYEVSFTSPADLRRSEEGFLECAHCSSGAMLVQRTALERVAGSGVPNRHRGNVTMGALSMEDGWGFFDPGMSHDAIDLDEDLAFCERVRASGGRIMIDITGGFGTRLNVARRLDTSAR